MRQRVKIEGWPHYAVRQKDRRLLFIIEKQVSVEDDAGRKTTHRFHVSTGAHSLEPALAQLRRFEADPFNYSRAGGDLRAPLLLTVDMALQFYEWQLGRGLSPKYARETNTWLARWIRALKGVDLRRMRIARDVLPTLDAAGGARRPMMAALKTLCAWLRTERHEMTSAEDMTRDLRLPQADRRKDKEEVAHPLANIRKVAAKLHGVYRDALIFQWATAGHVTELERFVRDERSRLVVYAKPIRYADGTKALAQVELWHKVKKWKQTGLTSRQAVEAARRLRERRSLPTGEDLNKTIYAACAAAKVPRFSYALRHSALTHAAARGVSEERRMAHAGHEERKTAGRYVDVKHPLAAIDAEEL